jgi:hypothetical protein
VSGKLHAPADLYQAKEHSVSIGQVAGWSLEQILTLRNTELYSFASTESRTQNVLYVGILTKLLRLLRPGASVVSYSGVFGSNQIRIEAAKFPAKYFSSNYISL